MYHNKGILERDTNLVEKFKVKRQDCIKNRVTLKMI